MGLFLCLLYYDEVDFWDSDDDVFDPRLNTLSTTDPAAELWLERDERRLLLLRPLVDAASLSLQLCMSCLKQIRLTRGVALLLLLEFLFDNFLLDLGFRPYHFVRRLDVADPTAMCARIFPEPPLPKLFFSLTACNSISLAMVKGCC